LAGKDRVEDNDEEQYTAIFRLLRRGTGVDFSHYKRPTIARRIARRMALRRAPTLADYVEVLQQDALEVQHLQEDVLIHVTSFFREPESFEALRQSVFPALIRDRDDAPIRIWVPGCSSGEEVYSLAITLFEALEEEAELVPIQFFGTDVSKTSVERARAGLYSEATVADIAPERLRRFFSKTEGGYQIGKAIRERCVFARQDITRDPPFSRLDLIVCRNTLIYLGQPIQRRVIAVMHYALKSAGFLMLGRAETTGASADLFSVFDKRAKIYRKKPSDIPRAFDFRSAPFEAPGPPDAQSSVVVPSLRPARHWDLQSEANRLLLARYAPAGIIVDAAFRIVSAHGATSAFLELPAGEASLDALKMVRPGLLSATRSALQEARHTRAAVRREGLQSLSEADGPSVNLEVVPLGGGDAPHFLISFERVAEAKPSAPPSSEDAEPGNAAQETIVHLRRELGATRDQLHSNIHDLAAANEELQSANEEILSSNEELQSTNEELDTAKEELQSTNEELTTLNDELHARNEELILANSDLANLLASVQIPIVMVGRDLTIRRFTPAAQRLLNLIPSDIGRPIRHIKPNINSLDLEQPAAEVIETMIAYESEVEDEDGRCYLLRIRPYKSVENRVDGAVLALFDISATRDALSVARRTGDAVVSTVREPILLLDSNLRVTRANPAFCTAFAVRPEEAEGRFVYQLGNSRWDIPELRDLLEHVLPERKNFEGFLVEHDFGKNVGRRKLLLDGRRIDSGRSGAGVILLVIRQEGDSAD
jgi:two-component system CheB/CheR fusion protein